MLKPSWMRGGPGGPNPLQPRKPRVLTVTAYSAYVNQAGKVLCWKDDLYIQVGGGGRVLRGVRGNQCRGRDAAASHRGCAQERTHCVLAPLLPLQFKMRGMPMDCQKVNSAAVWNSGRLVLNQK